MGQSALLEDKRLSQQQKEEYVEPPLGMLEIKDTCTFEDRLSYVCKICINGLKRNFGDMARHVRDQHKSLKMNIRK